MKRIVIFSVAVMALVQCEIPTTKFEICARKNMHFTECMNKASSAAIQALAKGDKTLNLQPLEPLSVERISIYSPQSTVDLKQEYKNITLHGLTEGLEFSDFKADFDKLIFTAIANNPAVEFLANYTLEGEVLFFTVRGSGRCKISMTGLKTEIVFHGEKTIGKDKQEYLTTKKLQISFKPDDVKMDFENLFEDSFLAKYFVDHNAKMLFEQLQQPFEKEFSEIFTKIANNIFKQVRFNQIFPEQ